MQANRVVIIGGGIGGLATAALLARDGYVVTVLEQNTHLGGRARQWQSHGYTFDMGPSWYMMPDIFERFFARFGYGIDDMYDLRRLETHYKVFFSSDRIYDIRASFEYNKNLFDRVERGAGDQLKRFLRTSEYIYRHAMDELVYLDYRSLLPLAHPRNLVHVPSLHLFETFHRHVARHVTHPDLQKILEFTTVFLGGSPYNTPAFYSLIAHTDFNLGIWHPMGGMGKIVDALVRLCNEYGVCIVPDSSVTHIDVRGGRACHVQTTRECYDVDTVVCNADYAFAETHLLDKEWQTYPSSYWERKTMSPAAFLMYLGVKGKLPQLEHHNLYFDNSWEQHFSTVYGDKQWPLNPSYYVHCPSRTDPSLAPPGGEVVIVLVPVAAGLEDTDAIRDQFADRILTHLEGLIGLSIRNRIEVQRVFAHRDFMSAYHAYQGAAFGVAHTLWQTAFLRPLHHSKKVVNLHYVGQYTNPGVGVPVCLMSAEIAHAQVVAKVKS